MGHVLSRRTLLLGTGTALALPILDAMLPSGRAALADPVVAPTRFLTFHFPIGANREAWKPSGTETTFTFGDTQKEHLARHQSNVCLITGVDNSGDPSATAGHTCGIATFLTARDVPQGIKSMGTSADQMIAEKLSGKTRLRSLELGTGILNENPNAEPGYDPVLKDHLSWYNDTPLPKEINPLTAFNRLFAGTDPAATAHQIAKRQHYQQSVIDTVHVQATRLKGRLGVTDNVKVDQYLTGVRELEKRIQATVSTCQPGTPPGAPSDIREHVKLMLDVMVLAISCDITRVVTFGYENTVTEMTHSFLGVPGTDAGYHIGVTHNQPGAPYAAINKWIVSQLAYLLDQLKLHTELGGTLLDHSIVYFASELGEGSSHSGQDIPMIVCGGGGGRIAGGRLLERSGQGNGNVLISLMQAFDIGVSNFGNGFTKPLPGLVSV